METFDVVVIGAGPAGCTTARFAASSGLKVCVIERKKKIGVPVQCGEYLLDTDEIHRIFPNVNYLDELFKVPASLISRRITGMRFFTPWFKKFEIEIKGFTVDRDRFDQYLAGLAQKHGVEILTNTRATQMHKNIVTTNKGEFFGKIIVGADGPLSTVAKYAGFAQPQLLCPCFLCEVTGDFPPYTEMYYGNIAPGGYAWIIPKKDGANVGLGIQRRFSRFSLKKLFNNFLKKVDGEIRFFSAGLVPMGGPISYTVKDHFLVVGDAAGMVMSTNGGGIQTAMIAGRIAGHTIADFLQNDRPLIDYETLWRDKIGKELWASRRIMGFANFFFLNEFFLEAAMRVLGNRGMEKAIRCRKIFVKGGLL